MKVFCHPQRSSSARPVSRKQPTRPSLGRAACALLASLTLLGAAESTAQSRVTIDVDYTNRATRAQLIRPDLSVYNREASKDANVGPVRKPIRTAGASISVVRPLGGVALQRNGTRRAEVSLDSYKWNGSRFVTDFSRLRRHMDAVLGAGLGLETLVLDNPSWAFQRRADGSLPGGAYKVSTYGNAEPPLDFNAWARYLRTVTSFLVTNYGRDRMQNVQFVIGREIGTTGHWTGSQPQFFRFYQRSVNAVRDVLPDAKVGPHFLPGSGGNAWGPAFVGWAKRTGTPYNFVGVSHYPFYFSERHTNLTEAYRSRFGVIKDNKNWNRSAELQIHEFALLAELDADGAGFNGAPARNQNTYMVGLMKSLYENRMRNVYQWGRGDQYAPVADEIRSLEGNTYHRSRKRGGERSGQNQVDAIFTSAPGGKKYQILAYNYTHNRRSFVTEGVRLAFTVDARGGTRYRYRSASYLPWNNQLRWTGWTSATTRGVANNTKSRLTFENDIRSLSVLKYEVVLLP